MTETNETQNIEEIQPQEPETALQAPAGYAPEFAQSFGELPEKWQKYLCAREDEVDKGFQKLRTLSGEVGKTLSEKFAARKESLKSYGVTSEEQWLKTLLDVDEYLSKDAQGAIKMLSEVYRVAPPKAFSSPAAGEGAKHWFNVDCEGISTFLFAQFVIHLALLTSQARSSFPLHPSL